MSLVLQVVGPRKSGKTTLMCYIIRELKQLGVKDFTVIKQTKHTLANVDAGDTRRFLEAGADEVFLLTKDGLRYQSFHRPSLEELVDSLEGLVLVEGGKSVKRRDWFAVVTWRHEADRVRYWKPLTIAEMGPEDDARLVAWRVSRFLSVASRAYLTGGRAGSAVLAALTARHSANSSRPERYSRCPEIS